MDRQRPPGGTLRPVIVDGGRQGSVKGLPAEGEGGLTQLPPFPLLEGIQGKAGVETRPVGGFPAEPGGEAGQGARDGPADGQGRVQTRLPIVGREPDAGLGFQTLLGGRGEVGVGREDLPVAVDPVVDGPQGAHNDLVPVEEDQVGGPGHALEDQFQRQLIAQLVQGQEPEVENPFPGR